MLHLHVVSYNLPLLRTFDELTISCNGNVRFEYNGVSRTFMNILNVKRIMPKTSNCCK